MPWSWKREAPLLAIVLGMFVASAIAWPFAEDRIPVHWNAGGEVDDYGGKFEGLLLVPLIAVAIWVLLAFLPRIDPARANYASFASTYTVIRAGVLAFLGVLHAALIAIALGAEVDVSMVIMAGVGLLFIVLGNVMGKIRPNFFAGIRTPWTLSSARSWTATHRLGGRVFIGSGLGFLAMAIIQQAWFLILVLAGTFAGIAGVIFYSYRVWQDDPDRVPVTQTTPANNNAVNDDD